MVEKESKGVKGFGELARKARTVAEVFEAGGSNMPSRGSSSMATLALNYAKALRLVALAKLEKLLKSDSLEPKEAIAIMDCLSKYAAESKPLPPGKRGPGRPRKDKSKQEPEPRPEPTEEPDFGAFDGDTP